jgi:hypothetical protein
MHVPQLHPLVQVWEPLHRLTLQARLVPAQQVQPSSHRPSQSSSSPLHVSEGGVHAFHAHEPEQVRLPVLPQLVVQLPDWPAQHAKVSSQRPSQSSSLPLQVSAGGTQLPHMHEPEQVRVPVVPQVVEQLVLVPEQQL